MEDEEALIEDFVTASQYKYVRKEDKKIVGMIQLRYYCNDYLEKYSRTYLLFKTTY
jgi:predicted acetyltransferase